MRRAAVFLLAAVGCGQQVIDVPLIVGPDTASVLVLADDGDRIGAFAQDTGDDVVQLSILDSYIGSYPIELTAFLYAAPLSATGLPAGELETGSGYPIPRAPTTLRAVVRGGTYEAFKPIDAGEIPAPLATLRLPRVLTVDQCIDSGGCFDLDSPAPDACVAICPEPPEPEMPTPPAPIESPCPSGSFAEGLPSPVVYVQPGESITQAAATAPPGATIALAKGTFDEAATLPDGAVLAGACAAESRVSGLTMNRASIRHVSVGSSVVTQNGDVDISDATLGGDAHALILEGGAVATLRRVVVEQTTESALYLPEVDARLHLQDVVVRDIGFAGRLANGIHQERQTAVRAERVSLEHIANKAIDVDAARATLTDIFIRDSGADDCESCSGLCAFKTSSVTVSRMHVVRSRGRGLMAKDPGCAVGATDILIEGSLPSPECTTMDPNGAARVGQCASATDGGSLDVSRFLIRGCQGLGVRVEHLFAGGQTDILLSDGEIADNPTGVELLLDDYPISRVANRVRFVDNVVNVVR